MHIGYSRNVNPNIAAQLGDYSDWKPIILISPDGQDYAIR